MFTCHRGISIFQLVPVAEETDLKLALSETPKTGFLATRPNYHRPEKKCVTCRYVDKEEGIDQE